MDTLALTIMTILWTLFLLIGMALWAVVMVFAFLLTLIQLLGQGICWLSDTIFGRHG